MYQGHPFLVEGDDCSLQVEPFAQLGPGLQGVRGGGQGPTDGQPGLESVGGDGGTAVILPIVMAADRVGEDPHADSPGGRDHPGQDGGSANALIVVTDQDNVGLAKVTGKPVD